MRFNLRLHGRTASGEECQADVAVYAGSQKQLVDEAQKASESAAWVVKAPSHDPVPEGSQITVEHVEQI